MPSHNVGHDGPSCPTLCDTGRGGVPRLVFFDEVGMVCAVVGHDAMLNGSPAAADRFQVAFEARGFVWRSCPMDVPVSSMPPLSFLRIGRLKAAKSLVSNGFYYWKQVPTCS